jgi:hypothetical protein
MITIPMISGSRNFHLLTLLFMAVIPLLTEEGHIFFLFFSIFFLPDIVFGLYGLFAEMSCLSLPGSL